MVRSPEFRVLPPRPKPEPTKRSRPKLPQPSLAITHTVFGIGQLIGLHLSDSGHYIAVINFNGLKRPLRRWSRRTSSRRFPRSLHSRRTFQQQHGHESPKNK
jgi:hypothetical protein